MNKQLQIKRTNRWLPEVRRGQEGKKQLRQIKRHKLPTQNKQITGIKCVVWGIQSITIKIFIWLHCNQPYHGDHFEMCRIMESLCCITGARVCRSVLLQNLIEKSDLCLPEWGLRGMGNWMKAVKSYKLPGIKINKYQGHDKIVNTALYYI